jgi:hypothetical protein
VASYGGPYLPPELQTIDQAEQGVQPCLYGKSPDIEESNKAANVLLGYSG